MTEPFDDRRSSKQAPRSGAGLGAFAGVFTPSILTILGIILFLRLGYVVGSAGLRNALVMIGLATGVSILTSISLAAIATNIEVKGGGDYYLISRTLGVEFGGAIGVVLYLAQTVSIAFYAIGFGEALATTIGWSASWAPQVIAAAAVAFLFVFAWAGADVASRFQFVVMILLVAALVSFYAGAIPGYDAALATRGSSPPSGGLGFWVVFAIFFPAVTGFTQGVSMSGDLRDPGRSLPRGTFAAVGLSTVVYVSVAILMAGNAAQSELIDDTGAMRGIAAFGPLIDAGVIAATLSSAMASFLGAPRILQSLARDHVFPILRPFAAGHGPSANPRRGVLLSLVLAFGTIALGELDVIAPIVSMFFLVSYGLLNYATYYEARSFNPSFRPRFRFFHRRASLAGAVACLWAMLAINPVAGGAAVAILYLIYRYLLRRDHLPRWSDTARAHFFQRAKESIRAMGRETAHARNWRPQILAFSADPQRRSRLLRFCGWLEGGSGLVTIAQIVPGEGALKRRERDRLAEELSIEVAGMEVDAHPLTVLAPDPLDALAVVVQSYGIGPMQANTVLFGLPSVDDPQRLESYTMALRSVGRLGRNVLAVTTDEASWEILSEVRQRDRVIDVWWDDGDSGQLSLLLAYLTTRTSDWRRARMRLVAPIDAESDPEERRRSLEEMLGSARIDAEIVLADADSLVGASMASSLVFVPMVVKGTALKEAISARDLGAVLDRLPLVAAVMAAAPVDLTAGPESGSHAELLAAEERLETARNRHRALVRQAASAVSDLDSLVEALQSDRSLKGEVEVATARLEDLRRRVLQAEVRIETAEREVAELTEPRS
jgi:amino acid transporter